MNDTAREIYKYNRTFSGTDTIAFIILPGCSPVCLGSITTISYSMLRNKRPVINIGRTNINGLTRGSRIYAGSIVFTLINQHWVKEIQSLPENEQWLSKIDDLKADELPPFDIEIISANEYGAFCGMYIYGIDFTDEAQTISVEDLFTENVFQFVARDISSFETGNFPELTTKSNRVKKSADYIVTDNDTMFYTGTLNTVEDVANGLKDKWLDDYKGTKIIKETKKDPKLSRVLYEKTDDYYIGNDVAEIQQILKQYYTDLNVTGIFDHTTSNAVKEYQQSNGLNPDGIVDDKLYAMLVNGTETSIEKVASCTRTSGAYVYHDPSLNSDIVDTISYGDVVKTYGTVSIANNDGTTSEWYRIQKGYISKKNMFSASSDTTDPYIISREMLISSTKNALGLIYDYTPSEVLSMTHLDTTDIEYLNRFQREHALIETTDISYADYIMLMAEADKITSAPDNDIATVEGFTFEFAIPPGTYTVSPSMAINGYLDLYKCSITNSKSSRAVCNLKLSSISEYDDGSKYTISSVKEVRNGSEIDFTSLWEAFIYNAKNGQNPNRVTVYVYPYDNIPYKWSFNISYDSDVLDH